MKHFSEMTEEEIVQDALKAVPEYLERIRSTGVFHLEDCVLLELRRVKDLYRHEYGQTGLFQRKKKIDLDVLDAVLAHFKPILRQRTAPLQTKYQQSRMVSRIRFATAEPVIRAALDEAGLTGRISAQRYRARVDLDITPDAVLRFYVLFRDLGKEGLMDGNIRAALDIRDALGRLGPGAALRTK